MTFLTTFVLSIFSILQAAGGLSQGVFHHEMEKPPVVWLADHQLHIRTTNSMDNSSMALFKTEMVVEGKEITISAEQQLVGMGPQPSEYHHALEAFKMDEKSASECSLWWLDPDGKKVAMEFQEAPAAE